MGHLPCPCLLPCVPPPEPFTCASRALLRASPGPRPYVLRDRTLASARLWQTTFCRLATGFRLPGKRATAFPSGLLSGGPLELHRAKNESPPQAVSSTSPLPQPLFSKTGPPALAGCWSLHSPWGMAEGGSGQQTAHAQHRPFLPWGQLRRGPRGARGRELAVCVQSGHGTPPRCGNLAMACACPNVRGAGVRSVASWSRCLLVADRKKWEVNTCHWGVCGFGAIISRHQLHREVSGPMTPARGAQAAGRGAREGLR